MFVGDMILPGNVNGEKNINSVAVTNMSLANVSSEDVSSAGKADGAKHINESAVVFESEAGRKADYKEKNADSATEDKTPLKMSMDAIEKLADVVTPENYDAMEELGLVADEDDPQAFVSVNDRINIELATYCDDYVMYGDISMAKLESMFGSSALAENVASLLKKNGVPITQNNADEVLSTLDKASSIGTLNDGNISYMLKNELPLSVDNVYTSIHSGAESMPADTNMSDDEWNELEPQVINMLNEYGMDVSQENIDNAKWMMEQKIPVTPSNLKNMSELKKYNGMDEQKWIDAIVLTMSTGFAAGDTPVTGASGMMEEAMEAIDTVSEVTDEELQYIVRNNYELNIKNFEKIKNTDTAQEEKAKLPDKPDVLKKPEVAEQTEQPEQPEREYIKVKRQLEEIRLMMTVQSGVKMLIKGIHIDTEPLENIVDELKLQEKQYTDSMFKAVGYIPDKEDVDLYKEAISAFDIFKSAPAYILGDVLSGKVEYNVSDINEKSEPVKQRFVQAGEAYETMMTRPRSDLGDSISKAFANVDDILSGLGMEQNFINQRAVRILAYNNMDITDESVMSIKSIDAEVTDVIQKMTPKAVVKMISEGINPLNMNISELGDKIDDLMDNEVIVKEEKYSEFLWKLQKDGNISQEDREAYIGVYRLLNLIDKGDHSVIGALVNEGADITLNNMLTAIRSKKAYNLDISIEVDKGYASDIVVENSISSQLDRFAQNESMSQQREGDAHNGNAYNGNATDNGDTVSSNAHDDGTSVQTDYYKTIKQNVIDMITPQLLNEMDSVEDIYNMSLETLLQKMKEYAADNSYTDNNIINEQYNIERVMNLQSDIEQVNENVLEMLLDSGQVPSVSNAVIAQSLMGSAGRTMLGLRNMNKDKDSDDEMQHEIDTITRFDSEKSVKSAYEKVNAIVERDIDKWLYSSQNIDIDSIMRMSKQVRMIKKLSDRSTYHVPVEIGDDAATIRVTVITGSEEKGRVKAHVESKYLGNITAEFILNNNILDGVINASEESAVSFINGRMDDLKDAFMDAGFDIDSMKNGTLYGTDDHSVGNNTEISNAGLYKVAKIFITSVREWGNELINN